MSWAFFTQNENELDMCKFSTKEERDPKSPLVGAQDFVLK